MRLVSDIYQSRVDNEAAIIARRDPVVYNGGDAGGDFALTPSQLRRYRSDGFLLLKRFFQDEEVDGLLRESDRLVQDESIKEREEVILEPSGSEVRSIFMVHKLNALLGQLVSDKRLVSIARQILGGDVYIHQSRLNLKPGFSGGEFFWHSDFETWHVEDGMPCMRALSCTVLLSENNEFNGPLMLIPGS